MRDSQGRSAAKRAAPGHELEEHELKSPLPELPPLGSLVQAEMPLLQCFCTIFGARQTPCFVAFRALSAFSNAAGTRFCITTHKPAKLASKTLLSIGFLRPIWCKRLGPQACTKSLFYGICLPRIAQNFTFWLIRVLRGAGHWFLQTF